MHSSKGSLKIRELFPLGRGGMGVTYLGCSRASKGFERLVVVKRLHDHLQSDEQACRRLAEEAELAGSVHHANVVPVLHFDRDDRGTFLVLDYIEGTSLFGLRRLASGKIPEAIALRIVLDALAGLEAIHSATDHFGRSLHILHRDISPENILVSMDGMARLTDFGIAKSDASEVFTEPSQLIGKVTYMAPEYLERKKLGPSMDVYSLGVTLWSLLAGESPWRGLEEAQVLVRILTRGVPELPKELSIGERLRNVVSRACDQDPALRYRTAREMAMAFKEISGEHRIADHLEVATYVMELAGASVSRVREQAARYLAIPSGPPEAEVSTPPHGIRLLPKDPRLPLEAIANSNDGRSADRKTETQEETRTEAAALLPEIPGDGEKTKVSVPSEPPNECEEDTALSPREPPQRDEGSLGAYAVETLSRKEGEPRGRATPPIEKRGTGIGAGALRNAGAFLSILVLSALGSAWIVGALRTAPREREIPTSAAPLSFGPGEPSRESPIEVRVVPPPEAPVNEVAAAVEVPPAVTTSSSRTLTKVPRESVKPRPVGPAKEPPQKASRAGSGDAEPTRTSSEIVVENPYD